MIILLVPLSATITFLIPMPAEFTLRGELVHMSEVGIEGSVYFAVVESGITYTLVDRWNVYLHYRNDYDHIDFTSIPRESFEAYDEEMYETDTLFYSVEQAAEAVGVFAEDQSDIPNRAAFGLDRQRINELLSELDGYYGNSLGLMVAIGLYEEQHNLKFSDRLGLRIAGTGTMEEEGWVGSIGGLEQKLLGASDENIDLFFVPADYEWYGEEGNEAEALRVKEKHDLTMNIVPVESFHEAIQYLSAQQTQ